MNLFELQERLKDFSKDQLVNEMKSPSGTAPPYLVLSELQRRTRMEQAMQADGQQVPQSTVADDTVAASGVPQGGLGDMARALAPQTDMTQNDAAAPVQQMAEGGQVSNSDQVQTAIDNVMGGATAMSSMPMMEQLAPAAARLGITPQGLSQAAARPVVPQAAQPQMPQADTSRIDDILARIGAAQQAPAQVAASSQNNWYQNPDDRAQVGGGIYGNSARMRNQFQAQQTAPAAPAVAPPSGADLAYVMNNAPTLAQREMALEAMKLASATPTAAPVAPTMFNSEVMRKAEGGVVRMQEGGDIPEAVMSDPAVIVMANRAGVSVEQFIEELSPEARDQLIRNVEQRASFDRAGDDAAFSRFSDVSRGEDMLPGQDYLDNRPMRDALRQTSENMGLAAIPSRLTPPASRMTIMPDVSSPDADVRAAGIAAYPSGRGNTAPYPSQPSLLPGIPNVQRAEPVPEGLGIEGVINPEAAVLGSGEMAAGHSLPDRLLNIPGINESMDRGPQYVGAMRNLIGLSDEGMPAQLAAEDAVMGMPVPAAPVSTYRDPNIDTTDDARAARGFGRSAYLDGLVSPADSPSALDTISAIGAPLQNATNTILDPAARDAAFVDLRARIAAEEDPNVRRGLEAQLAAKEGAVDLYQKGEDVLGDAITDVGPLAARTMNIPRKGLAYATSMVSPEAGGKLFDLADRMDEFGDELALSPEQRRSMTEGEPLAIPEDISDLIAPARDGGPNLIPADTASIAPSGGGTGSGSASSSISASETTSGGEGGDSNKWLALARFGLGLMQSQQPTFGGAIGEAGMGALDELRGLEDRDYERSMAERDFALKQAIAAARGRGGGGGAGLSDIMSQLGLSTDIERSLERLDSRLMDLKLTRAGLSEGGFFSGPDARIPLVDDEIRRVEDRIRDIEDASVGGGLSAVPNPGLYSTTDVRS